MASKGSHTRLALESDSPKATSIRYTVKLTEPPPPQLPHPPLLMDGHLCGGSAKKEEPGVKVLFVCFVLFFSGKWRNIYF